MTARAPVGGAYSHLQPDPIYLGRLLHDDSCSEHPARYPLRTASYLPVEGPDPVPRPGPGITLSAD